MSVRLEHNFRVYWYGKWNLGRENMSVIRVPNFQWKNYLYIQKKNFFFFFSKKEIVVWKFDLTILDPNFTYYGKTHSPWNSEPWNFPICFCQPKENFLIYGLMWCTCGYSVATFNYILCFLWSIHFRLFDYAALL